MNPLIKVIAGLINCTPVRQMDSGRGPERWEVKRNDHIEDIGLGIDSTDYYIKVDWRINVVSLYTQESDEFVRDLKFNFKVEANKQT